MPTLTHADPKWVIQLSHSSLQSWLLSDVPYPKNNKPNAAPIELGKMLFFDPHLSDDGNMSCATYHNPLFRCPDGMTTPKGFKSKLLGRASPTVITTTYNAL